MRKKDRQTFPETTFIDLLRLVARRGEVTLRFQSEADAIRFRFLFYSWRRYHDALDFMGLEPDVAATAQSVTVSVRGTEATLAVGPWQWLAEATVDGVPLRHLIKMADEDPGGEEKT